MSPRVGIQWGSRAMQPSRMFNAGAMHEVELMREVSAMRLAERAIRSSGSSARGFSPIGSLAFRVAHWRRLSTLRFGRRHEDLVVSPPQPHGA